MEWSCNLSEYIVLRIFTLFYVQRRILRMATRSYSDEVLELRLEVWWARLPHLHNLSRPNHHQWVSVLLCWSVSFQRSYLVFTNVFYSPSTENAHVTNRMTPEELRSVWPEPCFDREAMVELIDHDNHAMRKVTGLIAGLCMTVCMYVCITEILHGWVN